MQSQNEEYIQLLQSMMGGDLDAETARRVLAKHNNDIQAAASAMLEGDRGEDTNNIPDAWPADPSFDATTGGDGALNAPRRTNTPCPTPESGQPSNGQDVIDLTADNDPELARAMQMSLEPAGPPHFGPSNRAPDSNWAMVPSNVQVNTNTTQEQEDHSLSRAIEASLSTSYVEDVYEDLPEEEKVRKPGYPVALRTSSNDLYFAPLILHALFHVPQVRQKLAAWRWEGNDKGLFPGIDSPEYIPYILSGLFTYMDYTLQSYILIDGLDVASKYRGRLANSAADPPGELSSELYSYIVRCIETELRDVDPRDWERLFHLRYAPINSPPLVDSTDSNALGIENCPPAFSTAGSDTSCVRVDLRSEDSPSDLVSCLSNQLGLGPPPSSDISNKSTSAINLKPQAQALVAPSDVIAFEIVRPTHSAPSLQGSSQQSSEFSSTNVTPFRYPMHVYLDQFLLENAALAGEKRTKKRDMEGQLRELRAKRESLTNFEGKSTLKSLTSALYYFENVATKTGLESRAQEVESAVSSLQEIIDRISTEVQVLDSQISKLGVDINKVFEDPSLQKHRYDLRAVLVHDGLFGRSHIHSFVQHGGKWWKCQDASVEPVSAELVLTDMTGLHLGAGPYMLIYSRQAEDVDVKSLWPTFLKNNVKTDNSAFIQALEQSTPDIAASLAATYNPSPLIVPSSLTDDEIESKVPRRSMSAMSVVDEGSEEEGDRKGRMDIA